MLHLGYFSNQWKISHVILWIKMWNLHTILSTILSLYWNYSRNYLNIKYEYNIRKHSSLQDIYRIINYIRHDLKKNYSVFLDMKQAFDKKLHYKFLICNYIIFNKKFKLWCNYFYLWNSFRYAAKKCV